MASAARRLAKARPSTATTGMTSRTEEEVKTSSAASRRSSGNAPVSTAKPSSGLME